MWQNLILKLVMLMVMSIIIYSTSTGSFVLYTKKIFIVVVDMNVMMSEIDPMDNVLLVLHQDQS